MGADQKRLNAVRTSRRWSVVQHPQQTQLRRNRVLSGDPQPAVGLVVAPVVTFNLADWKPTPTCQSALSFTQLSHLGAPPQLAVGAHCCIGLYPGSTAINLLSRDSDLEFDLGHSLLARSHKTMVFQRSLYRAPIRSWRRPKRHCTDPTERVRAYHQLLGPPTQPSLSHRISKTILPSPSR